jgi:ABC-type nitrate/sulfonate/bicarbonate transport system permease component
MSANISSVEAAPPPDPADLEAFHAEHKPIKRNDKLRWRFYIIAEIILIFAIWEFAVNGLGLFNPTFLPAPSHILVGLGLVAQANNFGADLMFTLVNLVIGVVLASVLGIAVGLTVGYSRFLEVAAGPPIWTLYALPKVALAPILLFVFGVGTQASVWSASSVALVFLLAVFPILLNTIEGVRTVDPAMVRAGRVYGASGYKLAVKVIMPATMPFILVGLRRGVALGFIGAVLAEFLGGSKGIGHLLQRAVYDFRMDKAIAVVVIMVVVANIGLLIVDLIRKRAAPWSSDDPTLKSG